ncbi:MAG: UDPGP type 1 family protein [Clostridia bacterium]
MTYHEAFERLKAHNQEHLLSFYNELSEDEKLILLKQIEDLDFRILDTINNSEQKRGRISPINVITEDQLDARYDYLLSLGDNAIADVKVGAVLLAGGQGTRLGFDKPKGTLDLGENQPIYLFELLIKNLLDVVCMTNTFVPLFIMTSDKNDADTRQFFIDHDYFGYEKSFVYFFKQEMAPSCDFSGKFLLSEKGKLALSPNGNGGWFLSMVKADLLKTVKELGIEWLNVFSVDNPLQRIADPVFIGATIATGADCGAKVVKKASPDERVGVMCLEDGRPSIIEYYEMDDKMRNSRDADETLLYNHGVILNYLFSVDKLESVLNKPLPMHIVKKKIPYIDEIGILQSPNEPNGYKFETLVLDMIHMTEKCCVTEVKRSYEFAPIKNKTGIDSPDTARELLRENGFEF